MLIYEVYRDHFKNNLYMDVLIGAVYKAKHSTQGFGYAYNVVKLERLLFEINSYAELKTRKPKILATCGE